jgi:hypothetical protein
MNMHVVLRSRNMNNGKRSNKDNLRSRHKNNSSRDNLRSSHRDTRNKDNPRFRNLKVNRRDNLRSEVSSRKNESKDLRLSNHNTLSLKKNLKGRENIESRMTKRGLGLRHGKKSQWFEKDLKMSLLTTEPHPVLARQQGA